MEAYEELKKSARGHKSDYRLDPRPLAPRSQAEVVGATHKPTGLRVAFKRLFNFSVDSVARMRREIEFGKLLDECPFVTPIFDSSQAFDWFVMPIADGNADEWKQPWAAEGELANLLAATCNALESAHRRGWIHRDVKPTNILRIADQWTLADWGLNRRPRGQTTDPHRTRVGAEYGTPGFAAPELSDDAHEAMPAADIYSVGQLIGWALTGKWPKPNLPLLPDNTGWREVVTLATAANSDDRPQTVGEFRSIVSSKTGTKLTVCPTCVFGGSQNA
ncbi:hypothetical protein ACIA5C_20345 [Actinoplanes sp. NPDC051343]|uniref:protein kinase domain-containing protein n=1 Tax=Actinoplanes sp. NPDC051343 TaxID=3363906 RepID=UPI0037A8A7B4